MNTKISFVCGASSLSRDFTSNYFERRLQAAGAPSRPSAVILRFSTGPRKPVWQIPERPYTADGHGPAYPRDDEPERETGGQDAPFLGNGAKAHTDSELTLADLGQKSVWVAWKMGLRPGEKKETKIPFNPNDGKWCKSNDPSTWGTLQQAKSWASKNNADIGIQLADIGDGLHLGGIDLDTCRDPQTGVIEEWALNVIRRFASYTEVSPSGTGLKVFFVYRIEDSAELKKLFGRKKLGTSFKKSATGDHPPAIEVYCGTRYFAVTYQQFETYAHLRPIPMEDLRWLLQESGPAFTGKKARTEGRRRRRDADAAHDDSRSGKAFREGARLKRESKTYEEMVEALSNHNDSEIVDWVNEKGLPNDERELHRIYDNAEAAPDDYASDQQIKARLDALIVERQKFTKESREYKEIKDEAVRLLSEMSLDYRGDPKFMKDFRYDWGITSAALNVRLEEEHEKRRRAREAQQGGNPDDQRVAELNEDYCFVIEGGKATVYHECYDPVLKRHFLAPLGPRDFQYAFENQRVVVNTVNGPSEIGFGAFWLRHPKRRQYLDGVVFDPANRHAPTQLNLWKGFGVTPKKGSWRRLKRHIFRVICGGSKEAFKYVMRWLANAVQHPETQGEVVLVMRGGEGVGKGFLARAMVRLFGRHGLHIENPKHLTGNFNAHLHGCVMLFADEAFYAGDKAHTGILKGLVTEPMIVIEKKGKDVYQSGNFIHMMMASNHDWVVPASLDARRFCVLDVLDIHKDNHEYFEAIDNELENGGYEAMLYDLQRLNLNGFNVRKFPKTAALQDQKILSMKIEQKWLYRVLCQGYVRSSDYGLLQLEEWHETVTTQYLHESYERFAKSCGERKPLDPVQFGIFMHLMGWTKDDQTQARTAFAGENLKKGPGEQPELRKNKERKPAYRLGTLADARAKFATATGLDLTWPDEGDYAEEPDEESDEQSDEDKKETVRMLAKDQARQRNKPEWEPL